MRALSVLIALVLMALIVGCAAKSVNDPYYKVKRLLWQIEGGGRC